MAQTRVFAARTPTIFNAIKQPMQNVLLPKLALQDLCHFMLASVECYELAIEAFQKEMSYLFMKMVMTRNDDIVKAMLEHNPWLLSVNPPAMDYSFRKFSVPAFTYYLFTWDERGMEVLLEAIVMAARTNEKKKHKHEAAKELVGELLTQLKEWRQNGVTYQLADKTRKEQYYNPTALCKAMLYYESKCQTWTPNQSNQFAQNTLCHLQRLMPVGLIYKFGSQMKNKPQHYDEEPNKFVNPVYAEISPMRFMVFYPVNDKFQHYVLLNGSLPGAYETPGRSMVQDTRETIENHYNMRDGVVKAMEEKLKKYQKNPAKMFKAVKVSVDEPPNMPLPGGIIKRKKVLGIF